MGWAIILLLIFVFGRQIVALVLGLGFPLLIVFTGIFMSYVFGG